MRRFALAGPSGLLVLIAMLVLAWSAASAQSDAQIKQQVLRRAQAAYSGPCPCPYSVMRNGRACGARSAYSRPGGASPPCYAADVTRTHTGAYRRSER